MNFLSHYFKDHIPGRPYYNAGLIMPDLLGIKNRKWKVRGNEFVNFFSDEAEEVYRGCIQHLSTDAGFHNSALFDECMELFKALLKENGFNSPEYRPSFIAHIMLELLLDRLIVLEHRKVVDAFYADLDAVELPALQTFLEKLNFVPAKNFTDFFEVYRADRYAYHYADTQRFVGALNRVMIRVSQPQFTEKSSQSFYAVMQQAQEFLHPGYREFFE